MARKIKQGFHMELVELPLADLFPTKTVSPQIKQGRKYRQVLSSVREVGLIEPPVVTPLKNGKGYLLLDGHLRIAALEELGIEVPDEYVKSSEYLNSVKAEQFTDELLDMKDAPTCIFYPDDLSNTGGLNAVRKRGLKVPRDISTVGYDGIKLSQMLSPKLTTLRQDTMEIGKKAAKELIAAIERPKTTLVKRVIVEGTLIEGETVRDIS